LLEAPAAEAVEAKVAAVPIQIVAVEAEVTTVVADLHAVMPDVPAVGEGCLGLGSNSGEEEADGQHYGKFRFHKSSFNCCELNSELVYRIVVGRNCLRGESYGCVKTARAYANHFFGASG